MNASPPADLRPAPDGCLSDADLEGLVNGDGAVADSAARHVERCTACRARLEALAGTGVLRVSGVKAGGPPMSAPLAEAMAALRAMAPPRAAEDPSPGSPGTVALDPPERPGSLGRFAGYDILETVASGGMGVVFKAQDRGLQRVVAIKVLAPALAASATARVRFLREARAAAAVNHEHVVAIHAVGERDGLPFLVMQFVAGRSLQARLEDVGPMTPREVLRIGCQAAHGLAAAHAQGLVHRDVKPGNILLENSVERVKLTDFGLARAADATDVTRPGVVAGTPEYMAPEQARGERLDARADLFALGSVLYACATGISPFRADSTPATLRRVCDHLPPPVHEVDPHQPRWLGEIVARLMAKRPEDRYPDARTVARVLEEALARLQSGAHGPRPDAATESPESPLSGEVRGASTLADTSAPSRGRLRRLAFGLVAGAVVFALGWAGLGRGSKPTGSPFRRTNGQGIARSFDRLEDAIRGAGPGDVVELDWDGPRVLPPMAWTGQVVHLRAADGRLPVVVHASRNEPWLTTDAPLRLEGIELRSAGVGVRGEAPGRPGLGGRLPTEGGRRALERMRPHQAANQLLVSRGSDVELVNCRLMSASAGEDVSVPVLLLRCPKVRFRHCELFHAGGPAISWQVGDGDRLSLSNCVVMARSALFTSVVGSAAADFEMDRCTFVGAFMIASLSGGEALRGRGAGNVFSLRRPVVAPPGTGFPGRHRWQGRGNVYDRIGPDAGFVIAPIEEGSISLDLGLEERLRTKMLAGQPLTPADFALTPDQAARPGGPVGIVPEWVGPTARGRTR